MRLARRADNSVAGRKHADGTPTSGVHGSGYDRDPFFLMRMYMQRGRSRAGSHP